MSPDDLERFFALMERKHRTPLWFYVLFTVAIWFLVMAAYVIARVFLK